MSTLPSELSAYLPQDRLRALLRGEALPERATGSALFADISGFTPLTEQFTRELGARRGAEELTHQINATYAVLITLVEQYGGSVISFAGDAITCWFAAQDHTAAMRAVACALALQQAMQAFPHFALKIAVASGPAWRVLVGDPAIQCIDTLAGDTLTRMALGEHLAERSEVLVDLPTATLLGNQVSLAAWRTAETGEQFGVVQALTSNEVPASPTLPDTATLASVALSTYLLPAVAARAQAGQGAFLLEFRPVVAVFVRFGLGRLEQAAEVAQLVEVAHAAQAILHRFGGALLHVIVGDKGCYALGLFGAPVAHEDDDRRALLAAQALRAEIATPLQIGVSAGTLCAGALGSATRRCYTVLGDEINLAARLMQAAAPGEILASGRVQANSPTLSWQARPALTLKGKSAAVPVFALAPQTVLKPAMPHLAEPHYTLPIVGRQAELKLLAEKVALARQGHGQVVGVVAEAGMGKSRLVAEAVNLARAQHFIGYAGQCQSYSAHTPYQAWHTIWQAFFDVSPEQSPAQQLQALTTQLTYLAPARVAAAPLLGTVLNLALPDNDFTHALAPKDRQNTLLALLHACLAATVQTAQAVGAAVLFVLEDLHWADPLSRDLLLELAQSCAHWPVLLVVAYRPPTAEHISTLRLETLPHFTQLRLAQLSGAAAEHLIHAKLTQLLPTLPTPLPGEFLTALTERAQGNPFYLEELLNYLVEGGLEVAALSTPHTLFATLPASLHALVLSRIDQLNEHQKATLKAASIIGRIFALHWLHGYYPALGTRAAVQNDLNELARLDLTPLDQPEPHLTYIFKHIITQEVAYESLPYATRARLHEQLAHYLETIAAPVETIAYHYGQGQNVAKQREYWQKAGRAAQYAYANEAALSYYAQLLPLLPTPERCATLMQMGEILELIGQWAAAAAHYVEARHLAQAAGDHLAQAQCERALGIISRHQDQPTTALDWLQQAQHHFEQLGDLARVSAVLYHSAIIYAEQNRPSEAQQAAKASLALAKASGAKEALARALSFFAGVAQAAGDFAQAQALFAEVLALWRELGEQPREEGTTLLNLGYVALDQSQLELAATYYEQSLRCFQKIGNKLFMGWALGSLGLVALEQAQWAQATRYFEENLQIFQALGSRNGIANALYNLGWAALRQQAVAIARQHLEASWALFRELNQQPIGVQLRLAEVALYEGQIAQTAALLAESLQLSQTTGGPVEMAQTLEGYARLALAQTQPERAACLLGQVAVLRQAARQFGRRLEQTERAALVAAAQAQLDPTTFATAWATGEKMPQDAVVAYAL